MIFLEAEDKQGNKAKIEVTEFKNFSDAIKEVQKLRDEPQKLKELLKKHGINT